MFLSRLAAVKADQVPRSGPAFESWYELVCCVPTDQTETDAATPTNPPPLLRAYDWTCLYETALTSTSDWASTVEPAPTNAWMVVLANPMSTPPATPTKPPAAPPATVSDLKESTAETLTAWAELGMPLWLTEELGPTNDFVVTLMIVTPTPPAAPTNPPPIAGTSPKTSSPELAWIASPLKVKCVPNVLPLLLPS